MRLPPKDLSQVLTQIAVVITNMIILYHETENLQAFVPTFYHAERRSLSTDL